MKANETPEKLYLLQHNGLVCYCMSNEDDIEYTRTDAFIEKALKFLDGCIPDYIDLKHANVDNKGFIEDFKNYMKGE